MLSLKVNGVSSVVVVLFYKIWQLGQVQLKKKKREKFKQLALLEGIKRMDIFSKTKQTS